MSKFTHMEFTEDVQEQLAELIATYPTLTAEDWEAVGQRVWEHSSSILREYAREMNVGCPVDDEAYPTVLDVFGYEPELYGQDLIGYLYQFHYCNSIEISVKAACIRQLPENKHTRMF